MLCNWLWKTYFQVYICLLLLLVSWKIKYYLIRYSGFNLGKPYLYNRCYSKLEQHWIKCLCVNSSPIIYLFDDKKVTFSISAGFHKNSLVVVCCTFGKFKIKTLTPSRFKNQIHDKFKLPATIVIIDKEFLNKKLLSSIITVKLKFP